MRNFVRRIYILGLLFALATGINTYIGFWHHEATLQREMERSIAFKLDHIIGQITSDLVQTEKTLNSAEALIELEDDEDKILRFLNGILQQNASYLSIYVSTPDNRTIYAPRWVPPADVDARTRPWYQAAERQGKLIFTPPYLDLAEERWIITMAKPVYGKEQELLGVVGIDKSLQGLLELLDNEKASDNGHSFLLNRAGEIIVHPSASCEEESIDNLLSASSGLIYTSLHGQQGYLRWQTVEGVGLIVGTFAPISDFVDRQGQIRQLIATTLFAFLLVFSILLAFQKKHIIGPMQELERDILVISVNEDSAYRLPIREGHSFETLRQTINLILDKTQEHFEHIMYQQEELEAAYEQLVAHEEELQAQYNEIKLHETHIQSLAEHDSLTGLLNRRKFEEDLDREIADGHVGSVFMLDIDDFKNINDTQGHVYGDRVLQFVARLLQQNLRPNAKVYRFGGDEFLIILQGEIDPKEIRRCIQEIARFLREIGATEGRHNHITSSIGVARYPLDGTSVEELLIKADIAMYSAKKSGKNRYLLFEGSMAATFSERVRVERLLNEAIQEEGFILLYQPIVEAQTGKIAYFEALIRIRDNPISPAVFIPIAEESTLIFPIGRWVIKEAIKQLVKWKQGGREVKPISINLSPRQFYDAGLVDFLTEELEKRGIEPALIEIEITETVLIDNAEKAIKIIERIKELGIQMALDDFGTGYSSMNYITNIPVDRVKLDRSMTEKLLKNSQVMEGLISIAHGLKMNVVAEGVEKLEEAQLLSEMYCDYLQGYLFSLPVPPDQVEMMLDTDYRRLLGLEE